MGLQENADALLTAGARKPKSNAAVWRLRTLFKYKINMRENVAAVIPTDTSKLKSNPLVWCLRIIFKSN